MLDADARELIDTSVLCWLATVSPEGVPRVSPKELFVRRGDTTVVVANVASPGTAANLKDGGAVCLSVLDVFRQKGVQMIGTGRLVPRSAPEFAELAEQLEVLAGPKFPFASLFEITVTSAKPILAPRYRFFPETTEEEQIEEAMQSYGVRPAARAPRLGKQPC